jgi:hypothetical protein
MAAHSASASVLSARLSILTELDTSAEVSFMERTRLRLRVFGIVDSLERRTISTETATRLFAELQSDVSVLVAVP